jgi:hypothetical protein
MVRKIEIFLILENILLISCVHLSGLDHAGDNENHGEAYLSISLTQEASNKNWESDYYEKILPYEPHFDADEGSTEGSLYSICKLILQMRTAKAQNTKTPILHPCKPS